MTDLVSEPKATTTDTILGLVSTGIESAQTTGPLVDRVVGVFVEREVAKRADLLVKGFDKLATLGKAFEDINKPDGAKVFFGADPATKPEPQTYTEKRRQEIAKARKSVEKLSAALNEALASAKFDALSKALKGGDDNSKDGDD